MRQTPVIFVLLLTLGLIAAATRSARAGESDPIRRGPAEGALAGPATRSATVPFAAAPSSGAGVTRVAAALIAIVGLIFVLKWGGQKFFGVTPGQKASRAVELVGRNPVGPKQAVLLLRVGRRLLVVGDSAGTLSKLAELTDPDEVAELVGAARQAKSDSLSRTFGSLFKSAGSDFDPAAAAATAPDDNNSGQLAAVENDDTSANEETLETRDELAGLADRVRSLSRQLGHAGA